MINISIFWSYIILIILLGSLAIAFEITISSSGKRVIRRNYQKVIEPVMMILYGTIWVGVILRASNYIDEKFPNGNSSMGVFGYPKRDEK